MQAENAAEYTAVCAATEEIERELGIHLDLHQRVKLEHILYEYGRMFPFAVERGWRYI
jgi:hypothetical protein